jgi:hypothetical protein
MLFAAAAAVRAPGTVGSGFRIMLLTCGGAMGIRTPDLLHAMQTQHAANFVLADVPDRSGCATVICHRDHGEPVAAQTKSATLAAHRLGPEQRETIPGPVAMTSSASLVRQLPHCEARFCCHVAAIQQEGPTAVPGDQASDLHLLGSGGRI